MSIVARAATAAALIAAIACTDPAGTSPTEEMTGPEAGAVAKTEAAFTWFLMDAESGLQVHFGRDIVALCNGTGGDPDLANFKIITNPKEALRQLRQVKGDLQTSVWAAGPNNCAYYNSTAPLATGSSNFRGTDNDVAPFNRPDPTNTNAFGFMANGQLTASDGSRAIFSATYRGTWDGSDVNTIKQNTNIRLH